MKHLSASESLKLGIVGLGYVGLPLAVAFGRLVEVVAFDLDAKRIDELSGGQDRTREVSSKKLKKATSLKFTSCESDLASCNCFIVAVPTPIDKSNRPDLGPIRSASQTIGKHLKVGDIVIYESTVYPGVTEDECAPILEEVSGLRFNVDFACGYSPERVNPGDQVHTLENLTKIVAGSNDIATEFVQSLYDKIISAGTYRASSIKIAEAAKVIENTQRDLNIALVNEFAIIFNKLELDTKEVLDAAATKWNFLPFSPGLVGGHCIGVDPYYLTHKAISVGYTPEIILSGRRVNDSMGKYVANRLVKLLVKQKSFSCSCRILVLGLTFKENCPDLRNTGVVSIINELEDLSLKVDVYDPHADKQEADSNYGIHLIDKIEPDTYDAVVIAVAHDEFKELGYERVRSFANRSGVIFDIKSIFGNVPSDCRL